jgi:hypothetical protein
MACFFSNLKKVTQFYRTYYKRKVQEARAREVELCELLDSTSKALEAQPDCTATQQQQGEIRQILQTLETRMVEGLCLRARL